MMSRIDVAYRVYEGVNDTFDVESELTPNTTYTLTPGLYMTLVDLLDEIHAQVVSNVDPFDVTESSGVVTIETDGDFYVSWGSVGLRDWLGFDDDISVAGGDKHSATGSAQCPGVFVSSFPWSDDEPGYRWSVKQYLGPRQTSSISLLGSVRYWTVQAHLKASELAHMRSVMSYLLRGIPATWTRDTSGSGAWSYDNWTGSLAVVLDPSYRDYVDEWRRADVLSSLSVPISFLEYS